MIQIVGLCSANTENCVSLSQTRPFGDGFLRHFLHRQRRVEVFTTLKAKSPGRSRVCPPQTDRLNIKLGHDVMITGGCQSFITVQMPSRSNVFASAYLVSM